MGAGGDRTERVGADVGIINRDNLHVLFRDKPATVQFLNYRRLRDAAYAFANAILARTPLSEEQQTALLNVRDALFTAKIAIEREEINAALEREETKGN